MNNEELVLHMLTEIKQGQERLESEVRNIKLHLELETDKNINELIAVFTPKAERFDKVTQDIELLKFDVDNLKYVVMSHSKEIQALQK